MIEKDNKRKILIDIGKSPMFIKRTRKMRRQLSFLQFKAKIAVSQLRKFMLCMLTR